MPELEKRDIQGNILLGYSYRRVSHLFFAMRDVAAARSFLRGLEISSAARWPGPPRTRNRPDSALNAAFSYAGLCRLRPDAGLGQAFPAFEQGPRARVKLPGDPDTQRSEDGRSDGGVRPVDTRDSKPQARVDPAAWERADLWLAVYADDEQRLQDRVKSLTEAAKGRGLELLEELRGAALARDDRRYEHFGFRDDLSNPELEGAREPDDPPRALDLGRGKRDGETLRPIRAGEFVLGYENESGEKGPDGELGRLVKNGTFAAFLQLEQDVAGFRRHLHTLAEKYGRTPEAWGALMVGRKQDGTPLSNPHVDDTLNNFGYADDREGSRCPFGAHIRRSHPRDASGITSGTHRILRRGMAYGPPLPPDQLESDGQQRGLYFVALNASIERQFEFVQTNWINGPANSGVRDDFDPLVSWQPSSMVVQGDPGSGSMPIVVRKLDRFVTCRGASYFFMPGLGALAALAADPRTES